MKDSYTKKEVAEITGLAYRNVQFYTELGVVVPEIEQADGRGKFRRYSNRDLIRFIIAGQLGLWGMTIGEIRQNIRCVDAILSNMKIDNQRIKDSDLIPYLVRQALGMRIVRTIHGYRVVEIFMGVKKKTGEPILQLAIVTRPNGKQFFNLISQGKEESYEMDGKSTPVKDFQIEPFTDENMMSYVYMGIYRLLEEAFKRIP